MWMIAGVALASSTTLTVEVVDAEGQPIRGATVMLSAEGTRHMTNIYSGRFQTDVIYTEDGSEIAFGRFSTLNVEVFAPGFKHATMPIFLGKRNTLKRVRLEVHELPTDLDDVGAKAVGDHESWREATRDYLADPREQTLVDQAAKVAKVSARAWYRNGGKGDALELCLLTATRAYCDE